MTQTPVLSVREPRDVLAYVPYRLGFQPHDSLVVLCLRGRRRRLGLALRFDLPPPSAPREHLSLLARTAAAHARRDGADSAVLVAYRDGEDGRAAAVLRRVRRALSGAGIAVDDAWHVGDGRYRSTVCHEPRCCPVDGRPLADLDASIVGPEMVLRGTVVGPSRDALLADLDPVAGPAPARVEAARAARVAAPATAVARHGRRIAALRRWQRALDAAVAVAVDAAAVGDGADAPRDPAATGATGAGAATAGDAGLDDRACGVLLAELDHVALRDALMLTAVPGGSPAAAALVAAEPGAPVPPTVAAALDAVFGAGTRAADGSGVAGTAPGAAVEPDPVRCRAVATLLGGVVRRAGPGHRAPALALLAWLAWFEGDGARARMLCERAVADRAGYSLAELVAASLDRGVPPAWAAAARRRDLAAGGVEPGGAGSSRTGRRPLGPSVP